MSYRKGRYSAPNGQRNDRAVYYFDVEKCKVCPYKEGCYKEGANTKTYNNLEILANLNKDGKLKKLYLSGNDNIINWSPLSSLKWDAKSGW